MDNSSTHQLQLGERLLLLDGDGYLQDHSEWEPAVAKAMAEADGMVLDAEVEQLVRLVREYYLEYQVSPPMRALVKLTRGQLGEERGNSRYLYRRFPDGPVRTLSRYAGLPKPVSCI